MLTDNIEKLRLVTWYIIIHKVISICKKGKAFNNKPMEVLLISINNMLCHRWIQNARFQDKREVQHRLILSTIWDIIIVTTQVCNKSLSTIKLFMNRKSWQSQITMGQTPSLIGLSNLIQLKVSIVQISIRKHNPTFSSRQNFKGEVLKIVKEWEVRTQLCILLTVKAV